MNEQTTNDIDSFLKNKICGYSPDGELLCSPRWLFFHSSSDYKKPLCTRFTIMNTDQFSVAWYIKTKDNILRLSQGRGLLKPGEKQELTLYLTSSDDWPRDSSEYTMKRIKLVVENIRIPEHIRSRNKIVRNWNNIRNKVEIIKEKK